MTDIPRDEHQRRSPNCPFFTLISLKPAPKKAARGKAARTSKSTRLSVQSVTTTTSDTQSVADPDDSILTTATVITQGGRKTASTRTRKTATGTTTAKGRKTRTKKDEPVPVPEPAVEEAAAVAEGETTTAEPQPPAPTKPSRGKKRTSDEIEPATNDAVEAPAPKKKRTTRVRASNNSVQAENNDYAMFDPTPREADESAIEAELRALEKDMDVDVNMDQQLQQQLEQEQEKELQVPKKGRKTGTRKVSKQTRKAKEAPVVPEPEVETIEPEPMPEPVPVPVPEVQQQEEEPEPELEPQAQVPVPVPEAKPKTKAKTKSKKLSLPPQPPSQPRLSLHEMEEMDEPDELHEDSIMSVTSTDTVVREVVQEPEPAPPAPPAKKGRGRPSKKSIESARSSAAEQAIEAQLQASVLVPAKITPIPPPSIPAMAMTVELSALKKRQSSNVSSSGAAAPAATRKSQTDKDKALPPLPRSKQPQQESRPGLAPMSVPVPVSKPARVESLAPATPRKQRSPVVLAKQATLSPSQSPQSSDAENQPPSSRPATTSAKGKRTVLAPMQIPHPTTATAAVTPGGVSTPVRTGSPSKRSNTLGGLRSAVPWSAVDVDTIFGLSKENGEDILESLLRKGTDLSTSEKGMTVEEFIFHNAGQAERLLKEDCEAMVSVFEQQGTRAMRVLESLEVEE